MYKFKNNMKLTQKQIRLLTSYPSKAKLAKIKSYFVGRGYSVAISESCNTMYIDLPEFCLLSSVDVAFLSDVSYYVSVVDGHIYVSIIIK